MTRSFSNFHNIYNNVRRRLVNKKCSYLNELSFHTTDVNREIFEISGEDDFKHRVMRNSLPVIVNFHAEWCEPCHSLKPLLEKIATDNKGKIHLAEVLVDKHAELLQVFEVTAVPAVLAIHNGQVTDKFIGLVSNKEITDFVHKLLERHR